MNVSQIIEIESHLNNNKSIFRLKCCCDYIKLKSINHRKTCGYGGRSRFGENAV